MVKSNLTSHVQVDVPDEHVGAVNRFLAGLRGVANLSTQPNGTTRAKGDAPSRMSDGDKKSVIVSAVATGGARVSLAAIKEALRRAGFSDRGTGAIMKEIVGDKIIKRIERGVYVLGSDGTKALPAPKKSAGKNGNKGVNHG